MALIITEYFFIEKYMDSNYVVYNYSILVKYWPFKHFIFIYVRKFHIVVCSTIPSPLPHYCWSFLIVVEKCKGLITEKLRFLPQKSAALLSTSLHSSKA